MEITANNLHKALIKKSYKTPVVVQFHAPWCGPCRMLKPVLEKVHKKSKKKWDLAFADVKAEPLLGKKFNIFTIPEVKLIKNGEVIASFSGYKSDFIINNWLDSHLKKTKETPLSPIINQVKNNEIEQAKASILALAIQENPSSDYLKLLMALQQLESNNANAMQWLQKIGKGGNTKALVKSIRDLIDIDQEDKNPTTPTSSPYTIEPTAATAKIDLATFDVPLLMHLVHGGINEVRRRKGAAALAIDPILTQAALDQNNYQIRTDQLSHYQDNPLKKTVRERVNSFGGQFRMVGENVQFKGFPVRTWSTGNEREIITPTYVDAASDLIKNWVNSPGHYKNLINAKYRFVGTAVGWNPENSAVFSTQVFGA